jgi:hypothetical protein
MVGCGNFKIVVVINRIAIHRLALLLREEDSALGQISLRRFSRKSIIQQLRVTGDKSSYESSVLTAADPTLATIKISLLLTTLCCTGSMHLV